MPKLTPTDLEIAGRVLKSVEKEEDRKELERLAAGQGQGKIDLELNKKLKKHRLQTDDALETLSGIMHFGNKDLLKIQVAKIALELNGVLQKEELKEAPPTINFNFHNSQVNLQGVFNPKRES